MTLKRIRFLQELLSFAGLDDRLHLEWISSAEAQKFVSVVTAFTEKIRQLGPSPLRDFAHQSAVLKPRALPDREPKEEQGQTAAAEKTSASIFQ